MRRVVLIIVLIASMTFIAGCSSSLNIFPTTPSTTTGRPHILRKAELGSKWQMYQIEVTLIAGSELPVILKLADGDKVDGYFFVEKGDTSIDFQITANSLIYKSDLKNIPTGKTVADRFSFTASQNQGISYTLTLRNNADVTKKTRSTIFLEVIYPGTSPIFTPLDAK